MRSDDVKASARELFESTMRLAVAQRQQLVNLSDAVVSAIQSTDQTIKVMHKLKEIMCSVTRVQCHACGMHSMVEIEPGKWKCEICDNGEP